MRINFKAPFCKLITNPATMCNFHKNSRIFKNNVPFLNPCLNSKIKRDLNSYSFVTNHLNKIFPKIKLLLHNIAVYNMSYI